MRTSSELPDSFATKNRLSQPVEEQARVINQILRGHFNYYAK